MYKKVSTDMNFVSREKEVEKFWDDNEIFQKSMDEKEGCPDYIFYDGPPTANGKPHIGHVLTRVIKDMIPRYRTMKGYMVPRKAGWDTHGLPVELEVEKLLGLDGKDQIEKYGLEPFIKKCKESVWKYKGMWEDFSGTVGFWADMEHPYVTYDNNFIESEWWALKQIWDKGLLYKGFKIVPYCPRCGTPLSAQEVAQGYKDVKERSAIVRFKVKDEDAYILAWTTTPWTLPSNLALCVNPKEDYAKAIELYEGILKSNGESAAVYYNLGNTYYKAGKIAPAILNYERCLLLDPGDSDARFNLQMARQKTIDKIEPVGDFFLVKWFKSVENLGSADSWAKTGIVCFLLFIGCLILFFFSRWVRLKKIGFYLGVLFIIMVVFANIFASDQKDEMINRKHAIVFAPTVTVKSSPDASGTDLFVLHEGTNVTVKSTLGEWSEIELEDGNVGWMPSKDIEKI